jgi:hypothetical protein
MSCSECGGLTIHYYMVSHGIYQSSRAPRSRPMRCVEERRARREDNSEEDGVSGVKAQQPSREAHAHKRH